jgi:hypothetical protein
MAVDESLSRDISAFSALATETGKHDREIQVRTRYYTGDAGRTTFLAEVTAADSVGHRADASA